MGEKLRDLGKILIGDKEYQVELNKSDIPGGEESVHIQNESFRLEMAKSEFLKCLLILRGSVKIFKNDKRKGYTGIFRKK